MPGNKRELNFCAMEDWHGYHSGFGPLVREPINIPHLKPTFCKAASSVSASFLRRLICRVTRPSTVFVSARRSRPCSVFGRVEASPWNRHAGLPFIGGAQQSIRVCFDWAWHLGQEMQLFNVILVAYRFIFWAGPWRPCLNRSSCLGERAWVYDHADTSSHPAL